MNTGFELQEAVREARAKTRVPGVAAGLLRDGEIELAAEGVLELGRGEPVRPETPFRIASITKSFTATLCAASVGLDDRLRALRMPAVWLSSALDRLPRLRDLRPARRVVALVSALDGAGGPETHTTNLVTVDADGNACVLTTSLGLGAGDWLPGLDLHLNSMLGEADLVLGPLLPGERMESMMAPSLVLDGEGLELAAGSAGGTRLRSALVTVAAGILDEGLEPQAAVDRGRVHPAGDAVHARSARRPARCRASRRGSARSGRRTGVCRGRGSSSRRCGSPPTACRCRPHTSPASRCSRR
jgi:hypothetical protein